MHATTTKKVASARPEGSAGVAGPNAEKSVTLYRWRVVDITVGATVGVASGLVFWLWGLAYQPLAALLTFTPGLEGLTAGGWLFAGVLGGLIIRRPGAAVYVSLIAGVVEALLGNAWGTGNILFALIQGLGAEMAFAAFRYRSSRLGVAIVAGALAGAANVAISLPLYYAGVQPAVMVVYAISAVISGTVIAGMLSWLLARGLTRAGALNRFPIAQTRP